MGPTNFNQKTRCTNNLVSYFKSNDISALRKHVNVDHGLITKKIKKKVNNNTTIPIKKGQQ